MKYFITLLFICIIYVSNAQTYRYIYEHKKNIEGKEIKTIFALDINPENVKFYDYKFIEYDSLTQRNKHDNKKFKYGSSSGQIVKRNRNSFNHIKTITNNSGNCFSMKSNDEIEWKLHNETKDYQSYKLQKATTTFGGRNWTAWYSPDVPLQEGPYKFRGLPGLIFEIYDDENIFSYHLIKNTNLKETYVNSSDWVESCYQETPISITHKQWIKVKLTEYQNPYAQLYDTLKNGGTVTMDNVPITSTTELDKKTKSMQEIIRKYDIAIEKDLQIPYPKK